jgi:hypothetical protein
VAALHDRRNTRIANTPELAGHIERGVEGRFEFAKKLSDDASPPIR